MHSRRILFLTALFAVVVAACDQGGPTGGDLASRVGRLSSDTSSPPDTTPTDTTPPDTVPPDTVPPPDTGSTYRGVVSLTVNVIAITRDSVGDSLRTQLNDSLPPDTISIVPVANATVEAVNVRGRGKRASGTTDAGGVVQLDRLPVGTYRVTVTPPAGSGLSSNSVDVLLDRAMVFTTVVLFRQ